ncbi:MAG: type II secretion system protein [Candidatus Taylorbacteria bacterium]|nr:type II secretion system protein [Candidatus Taylorbacteria bacterium]
MTFSKNRAFTLVELMVAISIIGILTAIALVAFGGARMKSRDTTRVSDLNQIRLAVEQYYMKCKQYPLKLDLTVSNGCSNGITLGTFMSTPPKDPLTGASYIYMVNDPVNTSLVPGAIGYIPSDYILMANLENVNDNSLTDDIDLTKSQLINYYTFVSNSYVKVSTAPTISCEDTHDVTYHSYCLRAQ